MELRDYLRILRAHWLVIVAVTLVGLIAGWGYSALQPRVYTATTSGYVTATGADTDSGTSLIGDQLARSKVTSYLDVGSWRSVAEFAIAELGIDVSPETLVGRVTVTNPPDTVVIHVSAQAGSPTEARDLAEAWIRGMMEAIDGLEGDGTPGSAAITLIPGDSARLPTTPSSPNTRLNVVIGGLVGLALGIGYALVRRVLDRRLRDPRDIERETGTAVVGMIPLDKSLTTARQIVVLGDARSEALPVGEAVRELRTNLQYMDVDDPPRAIVVTSPLPGDGKSTVAANLAMSLAAAGNPVVLIDADLRRPMLAEVFGLPDGAGLTEVLSGRASLNDVAHTVGNQHALTVVCAGRIPPNPSEIVGSQRMRTLVRKLTEGHIVIIDSPPLLPVSDAAVLATAADGALIVTSAGRTTYEMLHKSLENITKVSARTLGIVLNRVPRRGSDSGYYGYQYQGRYVRSNAEDRD